MTVLGKYLERVIELTAKRNFRIFGPDETMSNRLVPIFDETKRQWMQDIKEPMTNFWHIPVVSSIRNCQNTRMKASLKDTF